MNRIRKHPYIAQALITLLVAMIVVAGFYMTTETFGEIGTDLILFIIYSLFLGVFFIYPLVATIYEGIILAVTAGGKPETGNRLNHSASSGIYDILLLFLAGVYEVVYISFVKTWPGRRIGRPSLRMRNVMLPFGRKHGRECLSFCWQQ